MSRRKAAAALTGAVAIAGLSGYLGHVTAPHSAVTVPHRAAHGYIPAWFNGAHCTPGQLRHFGIAGATHDAGCFNLTGTRITFVLRHGELSSHTS